ncbi:TolC family protein [Sphingobacterium sp. SRCM116780]|uniref:TolC family protein n=1 Tax=Sphingobacterium sp. SRCM116780 TaxID=2907623 RepID=UPI001F433E8E|nr:TolC family protein [Sphingobacterium sp. SRCM116780]UIR55348.1 TolC family protein [Sphingobacterium sp. SRCM116780]
MNMVLKKVVILSFFLSFLTTELSFAQQGITARLKEPILKAIQNSTEIKNSYLENQKTILDKNSVGGKLLPQVSALGMYGYLNGSGEIDLPTRTLPILGLDLFDGAQKFNASSQIGLAGVNATQVIFSGLQITNGKKALDEKFKAQQLMTEASYDQVAQEVVLAFDQIMLLKEVDALILDSEKRLNKEHLKVIKAIENGLAIPYDRDKIKLAMLELESKKAESFNNRELLYFKLEELTKMSVEELKKLDYSLELMLIDSLRSSIENRKELQALNASQRAYEYVLKKEKGARLPQVFAFGSAFYVNAFDTKFKLKDLPQVGNLNLSANHFQLAPSFALGVGVKWTVFDGNQHRNNIKKANIDLMMNQNKLNDTKDKLSLLNRKTYSDYRLAVKKIAVHQQQIKIADNNLDLASKQFEAGLIDVTERLSAENEMYKQSLSYYSQLLLQRSAALELLKSQGNLYESLVK